MSTKPPSNEHGLVKESTSSRLRELLWHASNYLSIYIYILVIYGGALVTEYVLLALIEFLLGPDVEQYPIFASVFDYLRVGLGLLVAVMAVLHAVIITFNQVRRDMELSRKDEATE